VRVRTLANGLRVVSSHRPSALGAGLALVVPAGLAREGAGDGAVARRALDRAARPEPRCDRAAIDTRATIDDGWVELVSRAPTTALELALWREASRLDALADGEDPELRAFYRWAYDPSHAVLSVVSSLDPSQLDAMIDRTVGAIPSRRTSLASVRPAPAVESAWREDDRARGWSRVFAIPGARTPDHYALELLTRVLADGARSRAASFVAERGVRGAVLAESFVEHREEADRLHVRLRYATDRGGRPALSTLGDELLALLAREGVSGAALSRARERWRASWRASASAVDGEALRLASFESRWQNARLALTEEDRYDAVTVQDVLRAVNVELLRGTARGGAR
jgi:predicted Zn-dependent peptidase